MDAYLVHEASSATAQATMSDVLLALVRSEQELRQELIELRQNHSDLHSEVGTFRTNLAPLLEGGAQSLAGIVHTSHQFDGFRSKLVGIEATVDQHTEMLKLQAEQIEAERAASDVLTAFGAGDLASAGTDGNDSVDEESELFDMISRRTSAITQSTRNAMMGALGGLSPEALLQRTLHMWRSNVDEIAAEKDAKFVTDEEAKLGQEARLAAEIAKEAEAAKKEQMVQATVSRKLNEKIMFAKLEKRISDVVAANEAQSGVAGDLRAKLESMQQVVRDAGNAANAASQQAAEIGGTVQDAQALLEAMRSKLKGLQSEVSPLCTLPPAIATMHDTLQKMTSWASFKGLQQEVEDLKSRLASMSDSPPELKTPDLGMSPYSFKVVVLHARSSDWVLRTNCMHAGSLRDIRSELTSHAKSLAALFSEKAGGEPLKLACRRAHWSSCAVVTNLWRLSV